MASGLLARFGVLVFTAYRRAAVARAPAKPAHKQRSFQVSLTGLLATRDRLLTVGWVPVMCVCLFQPRAEGLLLSAARFKSRDRIVTSQLS